MKVYESWEENGSSEQWCYDNYINAKTMGIAQVGCALHLVITARRMEFTTAYPLPGSTSATREHNGEKRTSDRKGGNAKQAGHPKSHMRWIPRVIKPRGGCLHDRQIC